MRPFFMVRGMDDELKLKIIEMWENLQTSGQIAAALGVTRNAVMGFISRYRAKGNNLRGKVPVSEEVKMARRNERQKAYRESRKKPQVIVKNPEPIVLAFERVEPTRTSSVALLELRGHHCRFIVGSGDVTMYCGKEKSRGAYCAEHYSLCYVPVRKAMAAKIARIAAIAK